MSDMERDRRTSKRDRGVFQRPANSGVWWVRYHDEQGREHREKIGPKGLALKVYQKRKNQIQERRFFPERIRRREVLLGTMIDDVLARSKQLRCYKEYERAGRRWKAALGGRALGQIVPGDIARYKAKRERDVAPATVNRELAFLRRVFNAAIGDRIGIDVNPVCAIEFNKENNQRVRFLTEDEEVRLRKVLGADEWPKVCFALNTGFRRGNQFRLQWTHVNFDTGIIHASDTKSGKDYHVPMNDELRVILRDLPSRLRSKWVFPSATGETPMDPKNYMNRVFVPALKRARIQNFHWHDLRHTFASRLVMKGVDLRTVQELMGHESQAMTLRYSHLSPAHKLDAVQRLSRTPTGTTTGTSVTGAEVRPLGGLQAPERTEEKRAGDRDRTGDVQLGKIAVRQNRRARKS